jgi:uncharacterized membrane protein
MSGLFLFAASFLATGVEMVEALTIILATGLTRGWRSTFLGSGVAALILAAAIAIFGLTLADVIPLRILQVVVGTFLLIFGLQWLRKAILRYGGLKAYHDESKIFATEVQALRREGATTGAVDWPAFVVSFKGVLLEGLEAAFIVITFGLAAQDAAIGGIRGVGLAAVAAGLALAIVALAGVLVHRPLSTVPENTLKFAVGLMLTSFGTFWSAEGIGVHWALEDATILLLLAFYGGVSWIAIGYLRRAAEQRRVAQGVAS